MKAGTFLRPALILACLVPSSRTGTAAGTPLLPSPNGGSGAALGPQVPGVAVGGRVARAGTRTIAATAFQLQLVRSPQRKRRCQLKRVYWKPRSPSVPQARECWAERQRVRLGFRRMQGEFSVPPGSGETLENNKRDSEAQKCGRKSPALIQKKKNMKCLKAICKTGPLKKNPWEM